MSTWDNDTPATDTSAGWANDTPSTVSPVYKPDPVVKPPLAFLKRFATGETKSGQDAKALLDAFKQTYGDQPIIAWRPEDIKAMQDWGIINSPNSVDPDSLWSIFKGDIRSLNEIGLKAIPGIPDTILRGINGLAGAGSEFVGQTAGAIAGAVTGDEKTAKKVHDQAAGMSWEAIQAWFLYEMSNGAGFGRVEKGPIGAETVTPVGRLPTESQFNDAATLLGNKTLEPNVKKVYNGQGITPAEIINDAQKDVTITQDVITGAKVRAYEPPVTTPAEWVNRNLDTILTQKPEEFKASVKEAGLEYNDVIDHITSMPEVAGRWTDALNSRAVEARVKELHPEVYDLYNALEQKMLEASNRVEELKAAKEEARFGKIDQAIEETKAKLEAEGGQGKRYKVYQKRLEELKKQRDDIELTSQGDVMDEYNRNIQAARMEWLKYDQQQRTLVLVLGRARRQAQAELEAIAPSELPLKEDVVNQTPQPQVQQQTPSQSVQNASTQAQQPLGGGTTPPGGTPPAGPTAAPAAPTPPPTLAQAQANVLNKINVGGKGFKEKLSWNRFYTRYFDMFNPVRQAIRDQLKAVGINYKTIKNTAADPYIYFRLTKGVFGKANSWLAYGTRNFHSNLVNGVGLKEILKPVADDLNGLRAYIASRRALELEGRGIQSGFDVADATTVVQGGQARFEPIHRALVDFQNRVTEYLKDAGLLSEQAYQDMLVANQEYVPFYRYFGEEDTPIGKNVSNRLGAKNPIKAIQGSEKDIIDPLESVIRNTYTYLALADKNAAGLKLVDLMNHINSNYLQVVPTPATAGLSQIAALTRRSRADQTIAVWRDGVPEVYKVTNNKDLVTAWQGLDAYTAGEITRVFSIPAKTLRAGATLTPDFMVRNFTRDMVTAFATAGSSPIRSAQGFWNALFKTKAYRDWQASGGSNAAMVSLDRHYLQNNIQEIVSSTNMLKHVWNSINHPVDSARAMSELFENATRLGAYMRKNPVTKAQMLESAFTSREATLDFARMGTQMRGLNMLDAFLNANLQGSDRIIRAFKDDPIGTTAKVSIGITMPSVYLWMANHKDPRYQHAHDYEKNLFWLIMTDDWQPMSKVEADKQNIPDYLRRNKDGRLEVQKGHVWKVPKPFELGLLFGSLPERMLDEWYDRDPGAIDSWKKDTMAAMIPQLLPQFIGVPIEGITNHSFFTGAPIVPDHLKGLLPEYQYSEYTSETAKLIGRMVGAIPGINDAKSNPNSPLNGLAQQITSPMILENYVQGWSGGLGMQALKVADAGLKAVGVGADKIKPELALEDIPFIKSFMIRNPSANPQSLTDFRNHNERNNIIMDTLKSQIKAGNMKEYDDLLKQYGVRITLNKTQDAISKQYKLIQTIYGTNGINKKTGKPIYTAQDKRQLIDSLYYSIDQMATQANKLLAQEDQFIAKYKSK